jgi:heme-degrading monooxygenase HmoA
MGTTYTSAIWVVKPGEEDDFVAAWREFAQWAAPHAGAGTLRLVRDRADSDKFLSFAPWDDIESIGAWKGDPEFRERIGRVKQHTTDFQPWELDLVAEVPTEATLPVS